MNVYLGIDVGTGSARAGFFDEKGVMLASATSPIRIWHPQQDFVEQSSEDIWKACCLATKTALKSGKVQAGRVAGIGFDATCSLVLLDAEDRPVPVNLRGGDERNVIVWMDHRATAQARRINKTRHKVLKYVGGVISPEMQTPKLLWIKENLSDQWERAARFLDLPDFLTYRATGDDTRSLCTTVCKWTYIPGKSPETAGWDKHFFQQIGLGDLASGNWSRIGTRIRPMGEPVGNGLTARAARELGLQPGTPVGVSIIDAHAGGLGVFGARKNKKISSPATLRESLALIGGTSSCHMAVSPEPRYIPGVWGPYDSAMIPGLWLSEGGQSATGALIDHIIHSHPASRNLLTETRQTSGSIYDLLNQKVDQMARDAGLDHPARLTENLHLQPDFHGNRSPRANPELKGMISGLGLSGNLEDLALLYLAAIQAVAYGTRHIIEEMNRKGYRIKTILFCGGGYKNPLFLREHADATGCKIILAREPEAVLLGASMLGAVAAGRYTTVEKALVSMNAQGRVIPPAGGKVASYHRRKYQVFHRMHQDFLAYQKIMQPS